MAKIGIFSDVHISRSSSIMPTYLDESKTYTTRLNMCIDSMKWAYEQFMNNNVDVIINCGDTFNSHTVSSDELSALSKIILETNIPLHFPNYTILGNHDKFNNVFNSLSWVNLLEDTTLVNDYIHLAYDDTDIYCISYYESSEFTNKIQEMLTTYPRECSKAILFMHGDINGSKLSGNKSITNEIGQDKLIDNFDLIINGHIHCHDVIYNKDDKKIINIGSLTTHSFADSNNHLGKCYILDTKTLEITDIENPHQIIFRAFSYTEPIKLHEELKAIQHLNTIVKIKCNSKDKETVESILSHYDNIIKYKLVISYDRLDTIPDASNDVVEDEDNNINNINVDTQFVTFLNSRTDLKADVNRYLSLLNE